MGSMNLGFSFSPMHCNRNLLSLLLLNVVGDAGVVEAFPSLMCFVISMLDQGSFSTYPGIIHYQACNLSLHLFFYSRDFINLLLMCVQVMKQGTIEGFGVFLLSLLCTLCFISITLLTSKKPSY
jgi:hypothetical protein